MLVPPVRSLSAFVALPHFQPTSRRPANDGVLRRHTAHRKSVCSSPKRTKFARSRTRGCEKLAQTPHSSTESTTADTRIPMILLVDHGSKRSAANDMLSDVAAMLRQKTKLSVYTAHMEIASPSIADGINQCVQAGANHVIVVPFFLSPGRHSTSDIPQMTAEALANHYGVTYDVRPPIGTHPGIVDIILDRAGLPSCVENQ